MNVFWIGAGQLRKNSGHFSIHGASRGSQGSVYTTTVGSQVVVMLRNRVVAPAPLPGEDVATVMMGWVAVGWQDRLSAHGSESSHDSRRGTTYLPHRVPAA